MLEAETQLEWLLCSYLHEMPLEDARSSDPTLVVALQQST
jgi:hypothetical protein